MSDQKITIKGSTAELTTPEGAVSRIEISKLLEHLAPARATCGGVSIPRGVKYFDSCGPVTVYVWEIEPAVHNLKWIAEDSPVPFSQGPMQAKYVQRRLALPYLLIFAVFVEKGGLPVLTGYNEAFFRTEPMTSPENDTLMFPALLNVSKFADPVRASQPLAWICTQYLEAEPIMAEKTRNGRVQRSLAALRHTTLEAGFNFSSEHHELTSYWSELARTIPEIADLDRWEKLSREDPLFVLNVKWPTARWKKKPVTVQGLVDRCFGLAGGRRNDAKSASDLARVILRHGKQGGAAA